MRVAELEALFTADAGAFDKVASSVEARQRSLDGKVTTAQIDADIATAEKKLSDLEAELDTLRAADVTPEVTADVAKAEADLAAVEADLAGLRGAKAELQVTADVSDAEGELEGLADSAAAAGADGGARAGSALGERILVALAAIPIAGTVIQIGHAIGDALLAGLDKAARADRLAAATGLDEVTVARLGTAAGEAYAGNFGESIAANMETARVAVEAGLLDPDSTQRDAQQIIESLSGVADLIGEDIPSVARSASQALRTGLARDAAGAFDVIIAGQQAGLNVSQDWLDTLDEYGTQARNLGLEAPQFLGLLNQAVRAGARDTDIAADALKEYSIRARDVEDTGAREAFEALGFSADEMQQKVAGGGDSAVEALDQTFEALEKIEDPAKRNAVAVKLFGTQAEDLGAALYAMDLDTAASQFENLEGAAARALDTLVDNTASKVEEARRAIETAATGVQGALAEAFAPQLDELAEFVTNNREEIVSMLFDAAEGAVQFGISVGTATASASELIGGFLGGPVASLLDGFADLAVAFDRVTPGDQESERFRAWADGAIEGLHETDEALNMTAEAIQFGLIESALEPAQEKLSELRIPAETAAALSDATNELSKQIGKVGYASDGTKVALEVLNGELNTSTDEGRFLDRQLGRVRDALHQQVDAAAAAGESQSSLRDRVRRARDAFIDQVTALGLTQREAKDLANEYGLIPDRVVTRVRADGSQAKNEARAVRDELAAIRDRTVTITTIRRQAFERAQIDDGRSRAGFATGGWVSGPGTPTSDSIPVNLSDGEFVVNARAAARHRDLLEEINSQPLGLAAGGPVSPSSRSITVNNYGQPVSVRELVEADRALELLSV